MKKHVTLKISGLVQGVFFRAATREQAVALNITGLVRNEPDGSVYVEAEADEQKLMEFVEWCHHGPPHAVVKTCDVREGILKHYQRFVIER